MTTTNTQHTPKGHIAAPPAPWTVMLDSLKYIAYAAEGKEPIDLGNESEIQITITGAALIQLKQAIDSAPELLKENEVITRMNAKQAETIGELQALNAELLSGLIEASNIIEHHVNDWVMPSYRQEQTLKKIISIIEKAQSH